MTQLFGDRRRGRERDRLLVDLRRQPADDAVHDEPRRARAGVGELALRGQRRIRPRHAAVDRSARRARARAARAASRLPLPIGAGRCDSDGRSEHRGRHQRAACACRREAQARRAGEHAAAARLPGEEIRLDRRRRRLGVRHRLRRPRPRAGERRERERPGARHRGLLEHRRPAVEVDADGRRREVRRRRQERSGRKISA